MTVAELERGLVIHERQIQEMRENQRVQGELLSRTDRTIADMAELIKTIANQMVLLQSGVDSLVKSMDTLRRSLEGGNGHRPKE